MKDIDAQKPLSVAILLLPESTSAASLGLLEVLSSAGIVWTELTGEPPASGRMRTRLVSRTAEPQQTRLGVSLTPGADLAGAGEPDIIIVTDLDAGPDLDPRGRWGEEAAWIRAQFARGATVCSVCTGSLFLAEAGLLDGEEATTHWIATPIFARCYPEVRLRHERILCPAGPEHRIITGGGASSWEDLALYLIARFRSPTEAIRISKIFVIGDRSEGQLPFAALPKPGRHTDAAIEACQAWIADHYAESNPVARMVERSCLAERTFKRRFKAATGYAPVDYVQTLRIEEAKQLLETTRIAIDEVAGMVGYEDPAFFRRLFKRRTGVTPARYRQRYQPLLRLAPVRA